MDKRNIRGVIFDQDGLMFDTERISSESWKLAGDELGFVLPEEFLCTIRGMNRLDATTRFHQVFGDQIDFEALRDRKNRHFLRILKERGVPVKPGLRELLAYLKEHEYKIIMATASTREYAAGNLREAGVDQYFSQIISGDMVIHAKPDPEVFLRAAEALGEKPEHCMVLEDSLNGVEAGLRGGFVTVMVPDMTQPDETLRSRVTAVCSSLHQVIPVLEGLNQENSDGVSEAVGRRSRIGE